MPHSPPSRPRWRALATAAVVAALALIAGLTLRPVTESRVPLEHICLLCGPLGLQDFVDNVLLFVPLGLALRAAGASRSRAVMAALAVTGVVELLQIRVITGRDASIGDVISNTLGGALGAALADGWRGIVLPRPAAARRLAAFGALGWLALLGATAWALAPRPAAGRYEMEWAPNDPGLALYHGEVLAVTLAGRPSPPGPLRAADSVLAALRARRLWLEARVTTGNARSDFAPIARVSQLHFGPFPSELVAIGERGCDLRVQVRLRVSALRLRTPSVAVPRAFPCGGEEVRSRGEPEGDTMVVAGGLEGSRLRATAVGRGRAETRSLRFTPILGWSFFTPWSYPFGGTDWPLSALWAGGMLLVVGYWAGRGGSRWAPALLGATALLGLGLLPLATGLAVPSAGEWGGTLLGAWVGWRAGRGRRGAGGGRRVTDGVRHDNLLTSSGAPR